MKSPYYMNTSNRIASWLSATARAKMFARFVEIMKPSSCDSVLDLGVTCDSTRFESNYFEALYPWKKQITCAGTEDGSHLEPFVSKFVRVKAGEKLPFKDKQFDITFSSATIEHVGGISEQREFVQEISRVSKSFFITTPNRWCPMEFHTSLPLIHFLPAKIYRRILPLIGMTYWSKEENLNLLSKKDIAKMGAGTTIEDVKLFGIKTNIIIYKKCTQ